MAALAAHPKAKRLLIAGPWQLSKCGDGSLATWRGSVFALDAFAPAVPTDDGMEFLRWKDALTREQLLDRFAREDRCPEAVVELCCGMSISIGLALRGAARRRTFAGKGGIGALTDEYSCVVADILEALKPPADANAPAPIIAANDPRLMRALFLAVARRYRVTEEALDAWDILTTADDGRIWEAALGADPKAAAAAGA